MSSSRHPDKWIVPGGGMEPEEEPSVAAAREVCEEVRIVISFILFRHMWKANCSFFVPVFVTNIALHVHCGVPNFT